MLKGIDVSHHQTPEAIPWDLLARAKAFVIVRHTYGSAQDKQAAAHVARARAAGLRVGAYHFFRASQPIADQLEAFRSAARVSGFGKYEDIAPAIDFEDDTATRPITPEQAALCKGLCEAFGAYYLTNPILYITQRDWGRVGSPAWALKYPLWVAHYSAASRKEPATPNGQPWAIWQHRVGPLDLEGPHGAYQPPTLDQNLANYLPLLSGHRLLPEDLAPPPAPPMVPSERDLPDADNTHFTMAEVLASQLAADAVERNFADDNGDMSAEEDEITVVEGRRPS